MIRLEVGTSSIIRVVTVSVRVLEYSYSYELVLLALVRREEARRLLPIEGFGSAGRTPGLPLSALWASPPLPSTLMHGSILLQDLLLGDAIALLPVHLELHPPLSP